MNPSKPPPISLSSGHCCVCAVTCNHVGGPWFCDRHGATSPLPVPSAPSSPGILPQQGYVPVAEVAQLGALVYCQACGAVIIGDTIGTTIHNAWHNQFERVKEGARYGRMLKPIGGTT